MQLGLSEILISCGKMSHCVTKSISNAKFGDKRISVETLWACRQAWWSRPADTNTDICTPGPDWSTAEMNLFQVILFLCKLCCWWWFVLNILLSTLKGKYSGHTRTTLRGIWPHYLLKKLKIFILWMLMFLSNQSAKSLRLTETNLGDLFSSRQFWRCQNSKLSHGAGSLAEMNLFQVIRICANLIYLITLLS